MSQRRFLFCSDMALYPPLLRVAEIMVRDHHLEGHVILPEHGRLSPVYFPQGQTAQGSPASLKIHQLPPRKANAIKYGFERAPFYQLLRRIEPDYIWLFVEFFEGLALQFLRHYRFQRHPRLIAYVAGNHIKKATPLFSSQWPFFSRTRFQQRLLWPRLDGVAACATKALECARRLGLPETVPVTVNYLPVFGPEDAAAEGISLPWPRDNAFIIGFAGLLSEQKGWKVLLEAVELLPLKYKVVIVGDGEQREELQSWLERPGLQGRAYYAGLLDKERLLASYPLFDVVVLPSITTPYSVEQFGAVLAEAMACGVPVIGSDSGAIPEAVGEAGLIVPEGDPPKLAEAIVSMSEDEQLRLRCIAQGEKLFQELYNCDVYARSMAKILKITN